MIEKKKELLRKKILDRFPDCKENLNNFSLEGLQNTWNDLDRESIRKNKRKKENGVRLYGYDSGGNVDIP